MSITAIFDQERERRSVRDIAARLERRERDRGNKGGDARRIVAHKLGIGHGTLERLVLGRVKRIDAYVRDRLTALLIKELEADICRLTHELEMARQSGSRLDSEHICEIETHLAKAKALIRQTSGGG